MTGLGWAAPLGAARASQQWLDLVFVRSDATTMEEQLRFFLGSTTRLQPCRGALALQAIGHGRLVTLDETQCSQPGLISYAGALPTWCAAQQVDAWGPEAADATVLQWILPAETWETRRELLRARARFREVVIAGAGRA